MSSEITVKNLTQGESCTIKIKSSCGSPAFQLTNQTNATSSDVYISYLEYNEKYMNETGKSKSDYRSKNSTQRKDEKPDDDRPTRSSNYTNSGDEGAKGD